MPLTIVRLVLIKQISIALQIRTSLTMGSGIGYPTQCEFLSTPSCIQIFIPDHMLVTLVLIVPQKSMTT